MDPHIHVEVNLNRATAARTMLASTFGLVSDLPTTVTSGCGEQVSLAMTSPKPERVTCLACREHAARWHTRAAGDFARMAGMPGFALSHGDLAAAARHHRDLARRFAEA